MRKLSIGMLVMALFGFGAAQAADTAATAHHPKSSAHKAHKKTHHAKKSGKQHKVKKTHQKAKQPASTAQ